MHIRREIPKELYDDLEFYVFSPNARKNRRETKPNMSHLVNECQRIFGDLLGWKVVNVNEQNSTVTIRGFTNGRKHTDPLIFWEGYHAD